MNAGAKNATISVRKSVAILSESLLDKPIPNPHYTGLAVIEVNTAYRRREGTALLQNYGSLVASDAWGRYYERTSEDNGQTWSDPTVSFEPKKTAEGVQRWNEGAIFLDEEKDCLLHFNNYSLFPEGMCSRSVLESTRILVRKYSNEGRCFSEPQQIIQRGHDEVNWAEGVTFGKNCMHISFPAPLKTRRGKILLPVARMPMDAVAGEGPIPCEAGFLIGEWVGDDIEWDLSGMVSIDPRVSSRGLCEPALAELPDGSILMVMRGSNMGIAAPGRRWRSVSDDGGHSWSKPEPLQYDTGETFFSPASGSRLIRSSRNEKLYWIGNIVPENPQGNEPRYPLQIAEVDEKKAAIKKDSVAIIDDKQPEDDHAVHLSNFRVYEDRVTGEFVLNLARICEKGVRDHTSPSYQYRIAIPGDRQS